MSNLTTRERRSAADSSPIVGRAEEQAALRDDLATALEGRGGLVIIGGEAGIGKTTLVRDLSGAAVSRGAINLTGHCYDLTVTPPYGPWLDIAAAYRPGSGMPELPETLRTGRIDQISNQATFFADVWSFFADLAAAAPVLLVLEDLHWADPASLELLRFLGPRLRSQRMLVLVTYRRDEVIRGHPLYQQLPALIRESAGRRLDLRPLSVADSRQLIHEQTPLSPAAEKRLAAYLEQHSEGNPFFMTELLRALREEGLLRAAGSGWVLDELDRIVMPSLVRQVIDGRVTRLGNETREALALAAVIGQDVPLDLWSSVLGERAGDLLDIVERATDAHVLEAARDGTRVRFVHALTREALYEGVLPPRRRKWHQLVGDILAEQLNVNPDAVAYHFEQAGDRRASDWYVRAGERAQRAYAWLMAKDRFLDAARLLEGITGTEGVRAQLLYRCGRLHRYSDAGAGIANLEAAERLAVVAGNRALSADATYSRGLLRCFADDFRRGIEELERGVVALEQLPHEEALISWGQATWMADALPENDFADDAEIDPAASVLIAAGIHHRRGSLPWFLAATGHLAKAQEIAEQFIALTDSVPAGVLVTSNIGHAHFGLAIVHAALGRPVDAQAAFARAREIYRTIDHHAVIGFTYETELRDVVLPYFSADVTERRQMAAAAESALALAAGAFPSDAAALRARLGLLFLEGKWAEAGEIAGMAVEHGNYILRREFTNVMTPLWYWQGRADLVEEQIRLWLPQGPDTEPGGTVLNDGLFLQRLAVDLAIDRGDLETARAWIEAGERWISWSGSVQGRGEIQIRWAQLKRAEGSTAEATRHVDAAVELASDPRQPLALARALRLRGALRTDSNDFAGAERDLNQSIALSEACAAPFERVLTVFRRARMRLAMGGVNEATADLTDARAVCEPLGARPVLEQIDALCRSTPANAAVAPAGLTPRELEVLRLVAQGMTDASVAEQLFISPRTVSQHLRSIYGKLDVPSRAAATRFAVEQNLT
jgi:DNA-binding CsgD family transcriptional regulator/tetratricopeptide (TPR) repeat protein